MDLVDVSPFTLTAYSFTREKSHAENAMSFPPTEDGRVFAGIEPDRPTPVELRLTYPCPAALPDGPLHLPQHMEEKWALFLYDHQLVVVSSWTREVRLVAEARQHQEELSVGPARGSFIGEDADKTRVLLDFAIRSHALAEICPLLSPRELADRPHDLAQWCFGLFGSRVHLACFEEPRQLEPERLLRTYSPLHIASARGDLETMKKLVTEGMSPDILGADQMPPVHWALTNGDPEVLKCLLDLGADVEGATPDGNTVLMGAAAHGHLEFVEMLLERGANPNSRDGQGFVALHMAAERGRLEVVRRLLQAGADVSFEALGHTPLSLARLQGEDEVAKLLSS